MTMTGPSSLITIKVAVGSSKLYRRGRSVSGAPDGVDIRLGLGTRDEPHPELTEGADVVEHSGTVDLASTYQGAPGQPDG